MHPKAFSQTVCTALCLLSASTSAATCQTHKGYLGGSTARQPASFTASCTRADQQSLKDLTANLKGYYPMGAKPSNAESYRVRDFRTGLTDAADAFDRINYALDAKGTLESAAGRWAVFTSQDHPTRHFIVYGLLGKASDSIYLVFVDGEMLNSPTARAVLPPPEIR